MPPKLDPDKLDVAALITDFQAQMRDERAARRDQPQLLQDQAQQFQDQLGKQAEDHAKERADQVRLIQDQQALFQQTLQALIANQAAGTARGAGAVANPVLAGEAAAIPRFKSKQVDVPKFKEPDVATLADFREWKQMFLGYTRVSRLNAECDLETRRDIIRTSLSPDWRRLWATGVLNIADGEDIEQVIDRVGEHIRSHHNPLLDRREFHAPNQPEGELIDSYYAALQVIDDSCDYEGDPKCRRCDESCGHAQVVREERLRDRLVCGIRNKDIQSKVLEVKFADLTLERVLEICRALEASKQTQPALSRDLSINQTSTYKKQGRNAYQKGKKPGKRGEGNKREEKRPSNTGTKPKSKDCHGCGQTGHFMYSAECSAKDITCTKCGKKGHVAACCRKDILHIDVGAVNSTEDLVEITTEVAEKKTNFR